MNNSKWLAPLKGLDPLHDVVIHVELINIPDLRLPSSNDIPTTVFRTIVGIEAHCVIALIGAMQVQPEIRDVVLKAALLYEQTRHIDIRKKPGS